MHRSPLNLSFQPTEKEVKLMRHQLIIRDLYELIISFILK
jgi:hypothetical protein